MNVAILGGGIAGLATAISLNQLGMSVKVFERRPSVHNLGAGVVCWPNGSFVLSEFGMLDELLAVAGAVKTMRRISKDGIELGRLDIRDINSAMGFPSLSVLREDLMRILLRRAEQCDVAVHYEARATMIDNGGSGCRVHFSDGTSVTADVIVGAEGRMHSVARKFVTGDNRPVFQGFVNWLGVYRCDTNAFDSLDICDYWGVGARFGIVPVSANTAYWAGGVAVTEDHGNDADEHLRDLRLAFDGWPSPIGEIVSNAIASNTKRLALYDHDPMPTWYKENVLLIGNAAHAALPTSGQGASQALEDAWFLAREFAVSPDDPETAMAAFMQKRLKKTAGIIMGGRAFAKSLFMEDREACASRDRNATQTDYVAMAAGMASGWSEGLPIGV